MTREKRQSLHPTSEILCEVYNSLVERKEVFFLIQDENIDKLDTIVKTVYGSYFDVVRFPTHEDEVVAFFCLIIKDHPMTDGNKRLAVLCLQIFCSIYELEIKITPELGLDVLAVSVENTKDMDNDTLFAAVKIILFG